MSCISVWILSSSSQVQAHPRLFEHFTLNKPNIEMINKNNWLYFESIIQFLISITNLVTVHCYLKTVKTFFYSIHKLYSCLLKELYDLIVLNKQISDILILSVQLYSCLHLLTFTADFYKCLDLLMNLHKTFKQFKIKRKTPCFNI